MYDPDDQVKRATTMTWRDFYYSFEFQPLDGVIHATYTHIRKKMKESRNKSKKNTFG
jgi:hypothetical protein